MWGSCTLRGGRWLLPVALCLLVSPACFSARESAKRNPADASNGVVVLEESDFERVPEAVRGQSLAAPGLARLAIPSAGGEVNEFDPRRDASADIRSAIAVASRDGKRVLLEIGGNWCPYCKMLDRFFEAQPELTRLRRKNFVYVKVNFSPENRNTAALSKYPEVRGFPHFFVLDGEGALVRSQRVATLGSNTGYSAERFRAFLEAAAPKP